MEQSQHGAGQGVNPAGPVIHLPAVNGTCQPGHRTFGFAAGLACTPAPVAVSVCPLLPRPQQASCLLDSALCSIFGLIKLMLLAAPRTHGIALLGSGSAFNRRGTEERTAKKLFPSALVPLCLLLLVSDKPEGFGVGFLN